MQYFYIKSLSIANQVAIFIKRFMLVLRRFFRPKSIFAGRLLALKHDIVIREEDLSEKFVRGSGPGANTVLIILRRGRFNFSCRRAKY